MQHKLRFILLFVAIIALAACSSKQTKEDTVDVADQTSGSSAQTSGADDGGSTYASELDDPSSILAKRVILFEFDKSSIQPQYREILAAHAQYVAGHPSARVTLEGHADERGTREYNLGLGERRATAVSRMLAAQGGSMGQLSEIAYGEERPVALCHDESCWRQNRRVEIIYTSR